MTKSGTATGLRRAGGALLRRAERMLPRRPRPAILMYHRIADERFDPWGLAVREDRFERQVGWLARNRLVIRLGEFAERSLDGSLPAEAVALTFDDGYACTARTAVPVLESLNLPATIFLPVELIELGREFWWDELERIVIDFPGEALMLDGREVRLGARQADDRAWPAGASPRTPRQTAFHDLWASLRDRPPASLSAAMTELRGQAQIADGSRESHRPMTPDEVRSTRSTTIEFGSHGLTHPSLPKLDPAEKSREIGDSVERCAAIAGAPPTSFAYPYGDVDAASEAMVEASGFACACTTERAFVSRRSRRFALPRLHVGDWEPPQFRRELGL